MIRVSDQNASRGAGFEQHEQYLVVIVGLIELWYEFLKQGTI